jgi:hypothetical protein
MIRVIDEHHLQVGDRTWWGEYSTRGTIEPEAAAEIAARLGHPFDFQRRQFVVHFENGWEVSIIWGSMTYSDNHDHGLGRGPIPEFIEQPETVEVAVLHKDREQVQGGDVMSYCDADQVNFVCEQMSTAGTDDTILIEGHLLLVFGVHSEQ